MVRLSARFPLRKVIYIAHRLYRNNGSAYALFYGVNILETNKKFPALKVFYVVIDSSIYLVVTYILFCCGYAFRMDAFGSLFFRLVSCAVFFRYFDLLRNTFLHKKGFVAEMILCVLTFVITYVCIFLFAEHFGYIEIAPIIKEVS